MKSHFPLYLSPLLDQRTSITEVFLHPQEFEDYQIGVDTSITFCLKELRVSVQSLPAALGDLSPLLLLAQAILGFTDALCLPLSVRFETAGKLVCRGACISSLSFTCFDSPTRPVVFSIDKEANENCTADFVLATLTESLTQTYATSSNGAAGPTTARATPSGVSLSTSATVAADVDSDLTEADHHARSHDRSHSTTTRPSRGYSYAGASSTRSRVHTTPDKMERRKTSVGDSAMRMRKGQEGAGDPPAPRDLMEEGLFDVENADDVMELDPGREREDTSLSDNQFFADFPHQGKASCYTHIPVTFTLACSIAYYRQVHQQIIPTEQELKQRHLIVDPPVSHSRS